MSTAENKKAVARTTAAKKTTKKVTEEKEAPKAYFAVPVTLINVRVVPDGAIAGQAAAGKELPIIGQQGKWLQTPRGWVLASLCVIKGR